MARVILQEHTVRKVDILYPAAMEEMSILCEQLMKQPDPRIVKVVRFSKKGQVFSHTMELLHHLAERERILADIFYGLNKKHDFLNLDMDLRKFVKFLFSISDFYLDIHSGNIMKDSQGNYKIIDLESIDFYKYMKSLSTKAKGSSN